MTPLLQTKLHPVRPQQGLVDRERIMTALDEIPNRRLTLISASAGFGKTTAIGAWLERTGATAAWVSLDAGDNSLHRFFHYVVAALQAVDKSIGASVRTLIETDNMPSANAVVDSLINDIARRDEPLILVLDDYQFISDGDIHNALSYLLEHAPGHLHIVMTSRSDPPFPLSRLRVRKQLLEVRAADLRFSVEESSELFRNSLPVELNDEHITALQKKTEGWIAGLQMAGLSLRGRDDVDGFIAAFTGADRYVLDYLIEEVLNNQSQETQQVMLELSVLERFNGALCEAVTGAPDGAAILEQLEEANLFLIPLDNQRQWYRYHKLFGDLLQHRLRQIQPDLVAELHTRASHWYEGEGQVVESALHALHSGDRALLREKIERNWTLILRDSTRAERSQLVTEAFSVDELLQSARLSLMRTVMAFFERDFNLMARTLEATERLIAQEPHAADYRDVVGLNLMMHGARERDMGENAKAVEYVQKAFDTLPQRAPGSPDYLYFTSQSMLLNILGTSYDQMRDYDRAEMKLHEAIRCGRRDNDETGVVMALGNLGKMLMRRGDFTGSLRYTEELETYRGRPAFTMDRTEAIPHQIRTRIALERMDLDTALDEATQGHAKAGPPDQRLDLLRTLLTIHLTRGDLDEAERVVDLAERVPLNDSIARLVIVSQLMRVELLVRRGDASAAADAAHHYDEWLDKWIATEVEKISDKQLPLIAYGLTNRARIEILRGKAALAVEAMERLVHLFKTSEQVATAVEASILLAVARERLRDIDGASAALVEALAIASGPGVLRPFVAEGAPVARLLQLLVTKRRQEAARIEPAFLRSVLDACRVDDVADGVQIAVSRTLTSDDYQLTTREQEILSLLAMGYANQKIADKLYLSVNTIKTHLSNLFDKLGAKSRVEALARAREAELL